MKTHTRLRRVALYSNTSRTSTTSNLTSSKIKIDELYTMRKLNKNAKLAFYQVRRRQGDMTLISARTGYSISHISNCISGRRSIPQTIANEMYRISARRAKNLA